MDKLKINYGVDIVLGMSFAITAITGVIMFLFLPEGVRQGGYQEFLGVTKNMWSTLHARAGLAMIVLSLVHLIMHWDWLIYMTKMYLKRR